MGRFFPGNSDVSVKICEAFMPLIFIINSTGVSARNSFVQNERLQVWEQIHSYLT